MYSEYTTIALLNFSGLALNAVAVPIKLKAFQIQRFCFSVSLLLKQCASKLKLALKCEDTMKKKLKKPTLTLNFLFVAYLSIC